jgi:4-hydroxybenzoate polyprenyltransferase
VPDERIILAIACSTSVILSTVFTQDFSDVEGDKAYGRRTVPIIFPRASRYYILLGLPLWSIALLCIWSAYNPLVAVSYVILGAFVGLRYFLLRDVPSDALSYRIYNVSTIC